MGWCGDNFSRGWNMWGGMHYMNPFLGLFIFGLVVLAVVLGVWWLVRRSRHTTTGGTHTATLATPLQIAQRRLASGEITVEEFERIRDRISDQAAG